MEKMEIEKAIKILRKEVRGFEEPIVTKVSRKRNPYKTLISCILSLRTKDKVTAQASRRLFQLAETPEKMLSLPEKKIQEAIYPVGFYRTKARNIRKVSRILIDKYSSRVPDSIEELLKLPNVGRKTANITLVFGFQKEGLPIDVHCHRIPNRLGWIRTKTPEETEMVLRKLLPKKYWLDFNNLFVVWGQNICLPISPWCSKCAIKKCCKRVGVNKSR